MQRHLGGWLFVALPLVTVACAGEKELQPWELPDHSPGRGPSTGELYSSGAADGGVLGSGSNGGSGSSGAEGGPNGSGGPGGQGGQGSGAGSDDGGAFGRGDGSLPNVGRPIVCEDLSICCSREKACSSESFACQSAALIGDPLLCQAMLAQYEAIGCANTLNLGPAIIPGFPGCIPKKGGGFF